MASASLPSGQTLLDNTPFLSETVPLATVRGSPSLQGQLFYSPTRQDNSSLHSDALLLPVARLAALPKRRGLGGQKVTSTISPLRSPELLDVPGVLPTRTFHLIFQVFQSEEGDGMKPNGTGKHPNAQN